MSLGGEFIRGAAPSDSSRPFCTPWLIPLAATAAANQAPLLTRRPPRAALPPLAALLALLALPELAPPAAFPAPADPLAGAAPAPPPAGAAPVDAATSEPPPDPPGLPEKPVRPLP